MAERTWSLNVQMLSSRYAGVDVSVSEYARKRIFKLSFAWGINLYVELDACRTANKFIGRVV